MRSHRFGWLLAKDTRELLASRAYWLLLLATGLLVGQAFIAAIDSYREMSGGSGGPAALLAGLSPLDGIVVPTLGGLWLAATLLLPFVVIRVVAHERTSGAWTLLVQGPASVRTLLASKLGVIATAWLLAWTPAVAALIYWRIGGNHLDFAETAAAVLGHLLFGWLAIGVAAAAAAAMESEASAAVITLGFTIGTWALEFTGAARGGMLAQVAKFTPGAVLESFEHGLVRVDAIGVMIVLGASGWLVASIWLGSQSHPARRWWLTAAVVLAAVGASLVFSRLRITWDWSEDRRNSFAVADEAALRQIRQPLRVDVHLAPEDPRMVDLRDGILDKLERLLPEVDVRYQSRTHTGLFEQADSAYGEVWYAIGVHRAMSRSTTPAIVVPILDTLAGVTAPAATESPYRGYPMRGPVSLAGPAFFAAWPLALLFLFVGYRRIGRFKQAS